MDQSPPSCTVIIFLNGWLMDIRRPNWPMCSPSFQFSEMYVVGPGRSSPHSVTKTTWSAELKVREQEVKIVLVVTRVIVSGASPFSIPRLLDSWILDIGEAIHILDADLKNIPPSRKPCLSCPGCCHLPDSVIVYSISRPSFCETSCFRMVR